MSQAIPMMSDEEVGRWARVDSEACFGALATARGQLPLLAMEVTARVTGLLAETSVRQTFRNNLGEPLEASYIFPLPDRAAVTGFRMEVKGRVVEGVIKERAQARQEYQQAIEQGHRAAITEEERPGVFTMRVGNIPPGEEVTVQLRLVAQLPFEEGEATFRFPLVVAPRYIPGRPLEGENVGDGTAQDTDAVPDASRISPPVLLAGYPNPVRLQLAVTIDAAGSPIRNLRSTLHVLEEERGAQGQLYCVALRSGERLNRDFVLRFGLGEGVVQTGLTLRPDSDGNEGTFLLTFWPPASLPAGTRPRDVIFVLDRSGSMEGWKMVAARRAVARMVDTLGSQDRFAVYAFDNEIVVPPELGKDLFPASDRNRFRAVEFLAGLAARGGTEMAEPLEEAAQRLSGGYQGRDRVLVLVTDGQVGNEDQILRRLGKLLCGTRVFTLGVDRAVNEGFLRRLAALGAGSCELCEAEDRLDEVMQKVHRRIGTPLIADIEVEPSGLELVRGSLVPARPPDLFAGSPLFIMGRYRGPAGGDGRQGRPIEGSLGLRGRLPGGAGWSEEVSARSSSNPAVAAVWARGQIRQLEDRYQVGNEDTGALERQIVETSLRFGVLSRFTAFLAVDRSEVVNPGGGGRRVMQPVEAPEGWDMMKKDLGGGPVLTGMAQVIGRAAPAPPAGPATAFGGAPRMMAMGPTPPAAPSPMRAGARQSAAGLARGVISSLISGGAPELGGSASLPPLDLAPYRQRLADLLPRFDRQASGRSLEEQARALLAALEQLVDDLASVGAPEEMVEQLREHARALARLVTAADPASWQRLLAALDELAQGAGPKTGGRRGWAFWKK